MAERDRLTNIENAFQYFAKFGIAVPNRYFVTFDRLPAGLQIPGITDDGQTRLRINCESVDLPTKNITTDDYKIGKHIRKSAFAYSVDPIRISFRCSADMAEKVFFDKWQELICDPYSGAMEYHANFVSDMRIEVLDLKNQVVYGIKLIEAYPQSVTASQLAFATANEILKVDITMAFTRYEVLDVGVAGEVTDNQIQRGMLSDAGFDLTFQNLVGNQLSPIEQMVTGTLDQVKSQLAPLVAIKKQTEQALQTIGNLNPASEAENWFNKISAVASRDWDIPDPAETIRVLTNMDKELSTLNPANVGMVAQEVTTLRSQIAQNISKLEPLIRKSDGA